MLIKTDTNQEPIQAREAIEFTRHTHHAAEAAHLQRETAPLQPDAAGMDVTNAGERMGRPMSGWTLQQKLSKIRPFLVFERSNRDPSKTGIYLNSPNRDPSLHRGHLMFVMGMESGVMPEFSIIEAEAHEVPDPEAVGGARLEMGMSREIRGWRSVLARLLKHGILSAHDVEKNFQISMGRDSERWQQLLEGQMEYFSHTTEESNVGQESANGDDAGGIDRTGTGAAEAGSGNARQEGSGAPEGTQGAGTDDPARGNRDPDQAAAPSQLQP